VLALCAAVEVLVVAAVELVEAVGDVLARVRVDDVEEDRKAEAVRRVDQLLELLGRACTSRGSRESEIGRGNEGERDGGCEESGRRKGDGVSEGPCASARTSVRMRATHRSGC